MSASAQELAIVKEALRRGATEHLLTTFVIWKRLPSSLAKRGDSEYREMRSRISKEIEPEVTEYRRRIDEEFHRLRINFGDPDRIRNPIDHYRFMRPKYYLAGYDDPMSDIFSRISSYNFLGKWVPGGLHGCFTRCLQNVPALLKSVSPDLPSLIASQITHQDGGFTPRVIAGSDKLSNHAFGLAIDIDPPSNPRLFTSEVIATLNEIVSNRLGVSFDFGKSYSRRGPSEWNAVTDAERVKTDWYRSRRASDALRDWLRQNLPTYGLPRQKSRR